MACLGDHDDGDTDMVYQEGGHRADPLVVPVRRGADDDDYL
jgi:hypothetical protein